MTLDKLNLGVPAKILAVGGEGTLRLRLLDMGLTPRTEIKILKVAPMKDPIELYVRGYSLTIRLDDAKNITVEPIESSAQI